MKIRSVLAGAALLLCAVAQGQTLPVLQQYSGVFRLTSPLVLRDGKPTSFEGLLRTDGRPSLSCRLMGKVWAVPEGDNGYNRSTDRRLLVVQQGSVNMACDGNSARLVIGDFDFSAGDRAWGPLQKSACLSTGAKSSCNLYGTQIDVGVYGHWKTWHVVMGSVAQ